MDQEDNVYLVDTGNHRVQKFTKDGKFLMKWGSQGNEDGQFNMPWGIEIDHNGHIYVADWRNDRIQKFASDGTFLMKFGSSGGGDGQLNHPTKVAVDKEGIVYVADFKNDRLQVFDAEGNFITKLLGEATLSKWGRERVQLDPTIVRAREMAHNLHEREKLFHGPISVEVDDEGHIFVLECPRQRVQVYHKQHAIFGGGQL
jgi:sugar lactone lactonase YvrE